MARRKRNLPDLENCFTCNVAQRFKLRSNMNYYFDLVKVIFMAQRVVLQVPSQFHRIVIGTKGATIQSIREHCRTKFNDKTVRIDCDTEHNLINIQSNSAQVNSFVKDQIFALIPVSIENQLTIEGIDN
jgi:ribosomal protein S3